MKPELGGKGYRVFIGLEGAMKQISITNMASDTAGQLSARHRLRRSVVLFAA